MAVPTLDKTWEFKVNTVVAGLGTTALNNKDYLWKIKEAFVNGAGVAGSFTTPWTVWGSSNSSTVGNNDGVDRWTTSANVVFNNSGVRSWIVLKNTAIAPNFQICIEAKGFETQRTFRFAISPTTGFGVAGGGDDGTTSARPTAPDEVAYNDVDSGVQYAPWSGFLHVMMSDDGECTRMLLARERSGIKALSAFWLFDKTKAPISAWTDASCFTRRGDSADSHMTTYGNFSDNANVRGRIGSDDVTFFCTSEMYASGMVGQNITVPDDQTSEWPIVPMALASETVGHRGVRKGAIYDVWWGSTGVANGDSYPDDGTYQFVQFADMIFPWNGAAPSI
jgi:hypothetical protein